jgi:hypothetical protein
MCELETAGCLSWHGQHLTKTGSGLAAFFAMDAEGFSGVGRLGRNADHYLSFIQMKIGGGLLLLPPYVFKSCGGTKFKVKQF